MFLLASYICVTSKSTFYGDVRMYHSLTSSLKCLRIIVGFFFRSAGKAYFFKLVGLHFPPHFDLEKLKKKKKNLSDSQTEQNVINDYHILVYTCKRNILRFKRMLLCSKMINNCMLVSYFISEIDTIFHGWDCIWWRSTFTYSVHFSPTSMFIFIFFPIARTLNFPFVKCNPTNKKNCGLTQSNKHKIIALCEKKHYQTNLAGEMIAFVLQLSWYFLTNK